MENQIIIRAFSELNQWIDCLIITDEKDAEEAIEAINEGFDNFSEGISFGTYSEAIVEELEKRKIDFSIIPGEIDYDDGGSNVTTAYEKLAERLIGSFKNHKIIIF